jgi:hypothetical protein
MIPKHDTIWGRLKSCLCTYLLFCRRTTMTLPSRYTCNPVLTVCFHTDEPPTQDFFSKLREHLLPRIQEIHLQETTSHPDPPSLQTTPQLHSDNLHRFVYLKNDTIYHHKVVRFLFTTYDVRRGVDIVNPGTSRCNIMLLADANTSSGQHPFLYARVIGAYHANVIYTGPGWKALKLDSIHFPPMNGPDAFGFVDPKDVLRGCHVLPAFAKGKRQANGVGISRCAKDGKDYKYYYVGR